MPRKRELTWQPGSTGRPGRWRKKFRGKTYYFSGGRGKTDQIAYDDAMTEWESVKQNIKANSPKRRQADYEAEIDKWSQALNWSQQHGEQSSSALAVERINQLKVQLTAAEPKPVSRHLTFEGHFDPEVRYPEFMSAVKSLAAEIGLHNKSQSPVGLFRNLCDRKESAPILVDGNACADVENQFGLDLKFMPPKEPPTLFDNLAVEKSIWLDRLNVMRRVKCSPEKSVAAHIDDF